VTLLAILGACSSGVPTESATPSWVPDSCLNGEAAGAPIHVVAGAPAGGDGTPEHPFDTPSAAIDAASPGWDIRIAPGEYAGDLSIHDIGHQQDLTLRG